MTGYIRFMEYEGRLVALGIITGMGPAIFGYLVAWGIWWLRHR